MSPIRLPDTWNSDDLVYYETDAEAPYLEGGFTYLAEDVRDELHAAHVYRAHWKRALTAEQAAGWLQEWYEVIASAHIKIRLLHRLREASK